MSPGRCALGAANPPGGVHSEHSAYFPRNLRSTSCSETPVAVGELPESPRLKSRRVTAESPRLKCTSLVHTGASRRVILWKETTCGRMGGMETTRENTSTNLCPCGCGFFTFECDETDEAFCESCGTAEPEFLVTIAWDAIEERGECVRAFGTREDFVAEVLV